MPEGFGGWPWGGEKRSEREAGIFLGRQGGQVAHVGERTSLPSHTGVGRKLTAEEKEEHLRSEKKQSALSEGMNAKDASIPLTKAQRAGGSGGKGKSHALYEEKGA